MNVLAHHIAVGHQVIAEWVQGMATGQRLPTLAMDSFTEPNAQHAREYARQPRKPRPPSARGIIVARRTSRRVRSANGEELRTRLFNRPVAASRVAMC